MVWSQEREADRPPLSVILPRLYLGAESDVTQDRLAALGISYVLSVSRCSPQPSFLPCSKYLRIPIDDSLWDDLLPWIPQALHFIDAAMSTGASVLVHCAAGISRSPALAVAYIMYSLGLDLDQAYRFVKERRPSISPNFNFLGQLQHFQSTLSQKPPCGDPHMVSVDSDSADGQHIHKDQTQQQRHSCSDGSENQHLSLSGKLRTLHLTLNQKQQDVQPFCMDPPVSSSLSEMIKPQVPTQLQLPAGSASLLEKRKSLTLSLTPLGVRPPANSQQVRCSSPSKTVHKREAAEQAEVKTQSNTALCRQPEETHREHSSTRGGGVETREQSLLSPLSYTLNRLLGWGERVLLGDMFV
uniref:protein-tyrosine-phosphatase n=2 Tax=Sphaeramia orbicularis TaxID=375764 RepID=A0A672YVT9_9TELE